MSTDLKNSWKDHYACAPAQLEKVANASGIVSAFNANIDAIVRLDARRIEDLFKDAPPNERTESEIAEKGDLTRGLLTCLEKGIAEEWLIESEDTYDWMQKTIGYDWLQMGGQGGIVANLMAACGAQNVLVHCASLPEDQGKLFHDMPNLLSADADGKVAKAYSIARDDIPMIHFILEFPKGLSLTIAGKSFTTPRANRFIATYDPLNFGLVIDPAFDKAATETPLSYVILSGYQLLQDSDAPGASASERIDASLDAIDRWRNKSPGLIVHLEAASTQDEHVRRLLMEKVAPTVDSIGVNERETIDLLEVIGEEELAAKCDKDTSAANLYEGLCAIQEKTGVPRIQLHMFGLYLTRQKPNFMLAPEANRNGMAMAAVIAASKAQTGKVDTKEDLMVAKDLTVSDIGLKEMDALAAAYDLSADFKESGLTQIDGMDVIALPTILVDNPVSLVGMGDTISSSSLVGAGLPSR